MTNNATDGGGGSAQLSRDEIIAIVDSDHAQLPRMRNQHTGWNGLKDLADHVSSILDEKKNTHLAGSNAFVIGTVTRYVDQANANAKGISDASVSNAQGMDDTINEVERLKGRIDELKGQSTDADTMDSEDPHAFDGMSENGKDNGLHQVQADITREMRDEMSTSEETYRTASTAKMDTVPAYEGPPEYDGPAPQQPPTIVGDGGLHRGDRLNPAAPVYDPGSGGRPQFGGGGGGSDHSGSGPDLQSPAPTPTPTPGGMPSAPTPTPAPGGTPPAPAPFLPGGPPSGGGGGYRPPTPPAEPPAGGRTFPNGRTPGLPGGKGTPNLPGNRPTGGRGGLPEIGRNGQGVGRGGMGPGGRGTGPGGRGMGGNPAGRGGVGPGGRGGTGNAGGRGTAGAGNGRGGNTGRGPSGGRGGAPSANNPSKSQRSMLPNQRAAQSRMSGKPGASGEATENLFGRRRPTVKPVLGQRSETAETQSRATRSTGMSGKVIGQRSNKTPAAKALKRPSIKQQTMAKFGILSREQAKPWTNEPKQRRTGDVEKGRVIGKREPVKPESTTDRKARLRAERTKQREQLIAQWRMTREAQPEHAVAEGLDGRVVPAVVRPARRSDQFSQADAGPVFGRRQVK